MTCIAWDGKTLAADRLSGDQWTKFERATKIRRIRDHLVGCAGNASLNREMMAWFEAGAIPLDLPPRQLDTDKSCTMIVITPEGAQRLYQAGTHPIELEGRYFAIGSGKEAAAAVMELGHTAARAVEIASIVCAGCGGGIDTLELA